MIDDKNDNDRHNSNDEHEDKLIIRQVDLSTLIVVQNIEEEDDYLPSFASLKEKTHQTIYGTSSRSRRSTISRRQQGDSSNNNNSNRNKIIVQQQQQQQQQQNVDKSPKGSVDERIRPLVDLINHHDCFATLSSCSGRMALFDPNGTTTTTTTTTSTATTTATTTSTSLEDTMDDLNDNATAEDTTTPPPPTTTTTVGGNSTSGKGHGRWLQVSHDTILPSAIPEWITSLDQVAAVLCSSSSSSSSSTSNSKSPNDDDKNDDDDDDNEDQRSMVTFLFEPMLLHIAACNLLKGQELLQIALQCGFRESGLIVTKQRVTVAIRTHGLTMNVPFFFNTTSSTTTKLLFYQSYLSELINEGNRRLQRNQNKLNQLYSSIQQNLFTSTITTTTRTEISNGITQKNKTKNKKKRSLCCTLQIQQSLPSLNLWGHAAVTLSPPHSTMSSSSSSSSPSLVVTSSVEVWVFGGYGKGPEDPPPDDDSNDGILSGTGTQTDLIPNHKSSQRSNRVYRLVRQTRTPPTPQLNQPLSIETTSSTTSSWSPYWLEVPTRNHHHLTSSSMTPTTTSSPTTTTWCWHGLDVIPIDFPKCQGIQACVITFPDASSNNTDNNNNNSNSPSCHDNSLIILFGGRTSPLQPLPNLIYIYHPGQQCFATPVEGCIQGHPPSPRWGHSLTNVPPLSSHQHHYHRDTSTTTTIPKLLLVGGCTVEGVIHDDPIYLLSWKTHSENSNSSSYLVWECITVPNNTDAIPSSLLPRFHHCTVIVPMNEISSEQEDKESSVSSSSSFDVFQVFVWGGLVGTRQNLLEPFGASMGGTTTNDSSPPRPSKLLTWSGRLKVSRNDQPTTMLLNISTDPMIPNGISSTVDWSRFGASSCSLIVKEEEDEEEMEEEEICEMNNTDTNTTKAMQKKYKNTHIVLLTGGLATDSSMVPSQSSSAALLAISMTPSSTSRSTNQNELTSTTGLQVSTIRTIVASPTVNQISKSETMDQNEGHRGLLPGHNLSKKGDNIVCGSLVHHQCIPISDSDFVLLGGGASLFAFGDSFARSHHVSTSLSFEHDDREEEEEEEEETAAVHLAISGANERKLPSKSRDDAPSQSARSANQDYGKAMSSSNETPVLFVEPSNAKLVKTCLEGLGFLNKTFRMTKVTTAPEILSTQRDPARDGQGNTSTSDMVPNENKGGWIALPVTESCWNFYAAYQPQYRQQQNCRPEVDNTGGVWDTTAKADLWCGLVVATGRQEMPLATGQFARHKTKKAPKKP